MYSQSVGYYASQKKKYDMLKSMARLSPSEASTFATQQDVERLAAEGIMLPGRRVRTQAENIETARRMAESERIRHND